MSKNVVYYIAGPMAGMPDLGRPRFAAAQKKLERFSGVSVLNPALLPTDMPDERYMSICLAMVQQSDVVILLDGWENSPGARLEREYALATGKFLMFEDVIRDVEGGDSNAPVA